MSTDSTQNQQKKWPVKKGIPLIALIASLAVGVQIILILFTGEAACFNEGCKIIERLTTVSPLFFNLVGFIYFLVVFGAAMIVRSRPPSKKEWLPILLFAGMAVEGVLLSYQIFVAHIFCLYCLFLFLMVLLLNAMSGRFQFISAAVIVIAISIIFSLLSFGPSVAISRYQSLGEGTFAVKSCESPLKNLYMMFSSNCPHCQNVLKALESCNSCEFHFNPVDQIESLDFPDLTFNSSYSPEINRTILSLLGIEEVPVVIVRNPDGLSIIKGEENIIHYVEQACFQEDPLMYIDSSSYSEDEELKIFDEDKGSCSVVKDCE